jgi:hypothetical protein
VQGVRAVVYLFSLICVKCGTVFSLVLP